MKLDYEAQLKHLENEEFDIVNKRRNEKIRDQQIYANEKMKLSFDYEINMEEISRKRKKDENENNRLFHKLVLENSREKEKMQNDYLIKNKELEDKNNLKTKEINKDLIVEQKKIKRKEKKDKNNFLCKKMEIEEKGKQDERHFQLQMEI